MLPPSSLPSEIGEAARDAEAEGWTVNRKLVLRLVRENDWLVRRRQRKKLAAVPRIAIPAPSCANEAWAMDFVFDGTAGGRTFRTLNVVDR